jgi:hypothetical protein
MREEWPAVYKIVSVDPNGGLWVKRVPIDPDAIRRIRRDAEKKTANNKEQGNAS